jgi:hypothetical protein
MPGAHNCPDTFRMRSRGSEYLVNRERSVSFAADAEALRFTSVWPPVYVLFHCSPPPTSTG